MHLPNILPVFLMTAATTAGFVIPKGQPEGVYQVSYDVDGYENHTLIGGGASTNHTMGVLSRPLPTMLECLECGGRTLDSLENLAAALKAFRAQCNPSATVEKGRDFYSIMGGTVAYFCNFGADAASCTVAEINQTRAFLKAQCGADFAGWRTIRDPKRWVSIGYEPVGAKFCGRGVLG